MSSHRVSRTDHLQIEDDAQENQVSEDALSNAFSPSMEDIISPASQDGQTKVRR